MKIEFEVNHKGEISDGYHTFDELYYHRMVLFSIICNTYKDKAWMIWNDFSVSEIDEYLAIGSGSDVARGALFATPDKDPFERIVTSIDAAATTTLFVDDGIDLLVTVSHENDAAQAAKALGIDLPKSKTKKSKKAEKSE